MRYQTASDSVTIPISAGVSARIAPGNATPAWTIYRWILINDAGWSNRAYNRVLSMQKADNGEVLYLYCDAAGAWILLNYCNNGWGGIVPAFTLAPRVGRWMLCAVTFHADAGVRVLVRREGDAQSTVSAVNYPYNLYLVPPTKIQDTWFDGIAYGPTSIHGHSITQADFDSVWDQRNIQAALRMESGADGSTGVLWAVDHELICNPINGSMTNRNMPGKTVANGLIVFDSGAADSPESWNCMRPVTVSGAPLFQSHEHPPFATGFFGRYNDYAGVVNSHPVATSHRLASMLGHNQPNRAIRVCVKGNSRAVYSGDAEGSPPNFTAGFWQVLESATLGIDCLPLPAGSNQRAFGFDCHDAPKMDAGAIKWLDTVSAHTLTSGEAAGYNSVAKTIALTGTGLGLVGSLVVGYRGSEYGVTSIVEGGGSTTITLANALGSSPVPGDTLVFGCYSWRAAATDHPYAGLTRYSAGADNVGTLGPGRPREIVAAKKYRLLCQPQGMIRGDRTLRCVIHLLCWPLGGDFRLRTARDSSQAKGLNEALGAVGAWQTTATRTEYSHALTAGEAASYNAVAKTITLDGTGLGISVGLLACLGYDVATVSVVTESAGHTTLTLELAWQAAPWTGATITLGSWDYLTATVDVPPVDDLATWRGWEIETRSAGVIVLGVGGWATTGNGWVWIPSGWSGQGYGPQRANISKVGPTPTTSAYQRWISEVESADIVVLTVAHQSSVVGDLTVVADDLHLFSPTTCLIFAGDAGEGVGDLSGYLAWNNAMLSEATTRGCAGLSNFKSLGDGWDWMVGGDGYDGGKGVTHWSAAGNRRQVEHWLSDLAVATPAPWQYAPAADVRVGVDRGDGVAGTLAVPPAGSVAAGVPVDNTVGTGAVAQSSLDGLTAAVAAVSEAFAGVGGQWIDQDTGGTDSLRFVTAKGVGVGGVNITAYLKSEWDAGIRQVRGQTVTRDDGRWLRPIKASAGLVYVVVFDKPGAYALSMREVLA